MAQLARSKGKTGSALGFAPPSIPFFPFVSVLISTMGILILLIVVIGQRARIAASRQAEAARQRTKEELTSSLELLDWELEMLRQTTGAGQQKVQDLRLALGHLEDHARRLRTQRDQLIAFLREGDNRPEAQTSVAQLQSQISAVNKQIEAVTHELEALRRKQGRRFFSIVPYAGPYGSARWPIYIECRRDAIVIQPEGIALTPEDFQPDLGPANPLEVALRAIREYWSRNNPGQGDPYPLLLVRPSGIGAYYVARAALDTWTGEFGYELIDEDWEIVYPPPNGELARQLAMAVEEARAKARLLAAVSPRRVAAAPKRFILSPDRGGLIPEAGAPLEIPAIQPSYRRQADSQDSLSTQAKAPHSGAAGTDGQLPAPGRRASGAIGRYPPDGDILAGQSGSGEMQPPSSASSDLQNWPRFGSQIPGETSAQSDREAVSSATSTGPGSAASEGLRSTAAGQMGTSLQSLAQLRGQDWAVPGAVRLLVPLTRPVRLKCRPDSLLIVPEAGLGAPIAIPWEDPPEKTVDNLVRQIWDYVATWGPAGRGMAWRPILRVEVAPGAEGRFRDLKTLLEGSGLVVEQADVPGN
ncbi:MAG: hypothetical protein NZ899_00655 [Thermoguttaceae bacterium]|nr:hypothetical protein [Thermoguttaceae bacterium]MDW8077405.1 hypothetical protein [Thermoguttaceae bacterium]